jgi:hypothetical protein
MDELLQLLNRAGVRYPLIGGQAMRLICQLFVRPSSVGL